ncbi:MAG: hypothetical protein ACFB50_10845 [Rubrobacteraceae bacterium]
MTIYRGAREIMDGSAERARAQKSADQIAAKAQRVRKAAKTAQEADAAAQAADAAAQAADAAAQAADAKAQNAADQLSSGVLEALDLGEMALLDRINGELPNQNLATLEDATKLGDGIVFASAMAVQDAAAFNLWASNAMIESAIIADLAVDKLQAGTFTAGDFILAGGGKIKFGNGISAGADGLKMPPDVDEIQQVITDANRKISNTGEYAAFYFFNDQQGTNSAGFHSRGIVLRAEGNSSSREGKLSLQATGFGDTDVAALTVVGHDDHSRHGVRCFGGLYSQDGLVVQGAASINGALDVDGLTVDGPTDINGQLDVSGHLIIAEGRDLRAQYDSGWVWVGAGNDENLNIESHGAYMPLVGCWYSANANYDDAYNIGNNDNLKLDLFLTGGGARRFRLTNNGANGYYFRVVAWRV